MLLSIFCFVGFSRHASRRDPKKKRAGQVSRGCVIRIEIQDTRSHCYISERTNLSIRAKDNRSAVNSVVSLARDERSDFSRSTRGTLKATLEEDDFLPRRHGRDSPRPEIDAIPPSLITRTSITSVGKSAGRAKSLMHGEPATRCDAPSGNGRPLVTNGAVGNTAAQELSRAQRRPWLLNRSNCAVRAAMIPV